MKKLSRSGTQWFVWILFAAALAVLFMLTAFQFFTGEHTKVLIQQVTGMDERSSYEVNAIARKAVHVLIFGFLAILLYRIIRQRNLTYAWLCITLLAVLDEWHQSFVPGRTPSIRDVALDSLAAFVFLLSVTVWKRR